MSARRFDAAWRETVALRDGTQVRLRLVQPEDKPPFERGFERLSPRSRYLRFFGGKNRLSEAELRYLTEMDGESHLAIGALRTGPDGSDEGIGAARFVRFAAEPEVAEVLPSNTQALSLLHALMSATTETQTSDGAVQIEIDIGGSLESPADSPVMPPGSLIERVFGLVAGGVLILRRVFDEARGSR